MMNCKKHIIAAGFMLTLPLVVLAEVPVVDDSDNFAMIDGRQRYEPSVVDPQYDSQFEIARNDRDLDNNLDDEGALAREDQTTSSVRNNTTDNATLIDKIQSLQQELQELRGQLEVQAHDLKLLQQQQVAFYKDLDSRLSSTSTSAKIEVPSKPKVDLSLSANQPASGKRTSVSQPEVSQTRESTSVPVAVIPVSRVNPADEQISYLAAYELVKNRRYDDALNAMNQFVQKYPKGGYTANAQYWLGELYLVKKEYSKAVEHFNIVLQQFPTSSKSAASMLKMGYAYATLGNKPEAKKYLQQVVRAYPDTPTAQLASSKLRTI
jgi:tol-pal system protein YbgF